MQIVLIVVGVALIAFGAYVLLRHSDKPGGNIAFRGFTVSSKGAGLPIIVVGLAAVVVAVLTPTVNRANDSTTTTVPGSSDGPSPGPDRPRQSSESSESSAASAEPADPVEAAIAAYPCLEATLAGHPAVEPESAEPLELGRTSTIASRPEALFLTQGGRLLAVLKLEFDSGPSSVYDRKVLVSGLTDAECEPVKHAYYDAARADDAYGRSVLTWRQGDRSFQIDFDHGPQGADAEFREARVPPVTAADLGACLNDYLDGRKVTFRERLEVGRTFGLTVAPTALFLFHGDDLLGMVRVEKRAFASMLSVFELVDTTCKPVRNTLNDGKSGATATFSLEGKRYRLTFDYHAGGADAGLVVLPT